MSPTSPARLQPGRPAPLGATVQDGGVNFAVFSKYARRVELLLFDDEDAPAPARVITLDAAAHRTNYYWHVFVPGVDHGQLYAWRVDGPREPAEGHRYDGEKVLLDPYARAVAGQPRYDRQAARKRGDNCARALRGVVIDPARYDWEGDRPLPSPGGREFIYEMHAAAFTAGPSSGVPEDLRGTYAGITAKIDHLRSLGVTAVELMPVHEYDPQDAPRGLANYWGYSSLAWFAPHRAYAAAASPEGAVDEFRDMVKALHRAGIRVILDVVYNHTAEGGPDGPVLSWRGFENSAYYMLAEDKSLYRDFTGCGNTVNANHSVVRRLIRDSLAWWVGEMHVDGFRFDLASAMTRGEDGQPLAQPPVVWAIESDPVMAATTLVAEAWDTGGLYQVGRFPGDRFAQWNGRFRDDVRRFWRGDSDTIENLMARLVGSPDLFSDVGARPSQSVNYAACHDGFCLRDLVSYERKHNLANREDNRDGSDDNIAWNCGHEGETDDPAINGLRARQARNFLVTVLLAHGTPMLLAGDEFGQTRQGNNNPWCQDNALNWLDWNLDDARSGLLRFTRLLSAFAADLRILHEDRFWAATSPTRAGDVSWHGLRAGQPDWSPASRLLAFSLEHRSGGEMVYAALNAGAAARTVQLPPLPRGDHWRLVVDTAQPSPQDIRPVASAPVVTTGSLEVGAHAAVVVHCRPITV